MRSPGRWQRMFAYTMTGLIAVGPAAACKRGHAQTAPIKEEGLVITSDTEGLLFTWIDDKGDFHVETHVPDVPMTGRDCVRVRDPNRDESADPDRFTVVDLRQAGTDGKFPVRSMSRADFEALAVARRQKGGPTLAAAEPEPSSGSNGQAPGSAPTPAASVRAAVVIYGAEWCGACHDAARYLRRKGIAYIEKDVEKDPSAAREMQAKLAKSGLRGGSIPVLDVHGSIMVGFNPAEVDKALGMPM